MGRTPTRSVLDREDSLLARAKVPTTLDVSSGIAAAAAAAVEELGPERGGASPTRCSARPTPRTPVLERRHLRRVAVIRIGAPATFAIRPLFGWPEDLRATISVGEQIVRGGFEFDGREIVALDPDEIARFAASVAGRAEAVAISSVFAPVSAEHELTARDVVRKELGHDIPVSLSHEIGSIGLLERENATVLNAALTSVAHDVAGAFREALEACGLDPVTFFAQNDGTLMDLEYALRYPVLTIGSGPAELDPRRRLSHRVHRCDRRRRRGDLGRRRGPGERVPSGVELGRRDRGDPDELPDAGPRDHRGRGWHDRAR